jgi:DNA-binding response OmpR family regulator
MKVLVVEDDLALSGVLSYTLRQAGYEVIAAYDGMDALETWQAERPDLIILDLNLPLLDGMEVCRRIRAQADTPIIILSVRGEEDDIVKGLELGADDYVTKPFSPREFLARVQASLRRTGALAAPGPLSVGHFTFDRERLEVHRPGLAPVQLTPLESRLLEELMLHQGHVVPVDNLIAVIWGPYGADRAMLKQLVYRLRRKIEDDPSNPLYLETVPGVGYTFPEEPST